MVRCAGCGSENPDGKKFCGECGAELVSGCPSCGAPILEGKRFCGDCGKPLSAASPPPSRRAKERIDAAEGDVEGERKTITALFADIKGSTELEQDLDPEDARLIVDPALKLMIEAVRRYDGYVVQSTGDGIFAMFGAPLAHEDHAQRALYAGLRMQEELKRYSTTLRERGRAPIEVRVGVNTGEVVVREIQTAEGHAEYTPIGHAANLASRMQTLAATGTIAATEDTRKLCEGYFTFRALGPTRVKGLSDPVNVHEVTGLGPLRTRLQASARRGLSRFVGRESELEQIKRALELVRKGRGQIVAAVGEAGVGKSRLFYEFQAIAQSGCLVLETLSVSHGKASAYLPLTELLKGYFHLTPEDDVRKRREKIGGKVLMLDRALEEDLPFFFTLLEVADSDDPLAQMAPDLKRRRTLDAIKRLLLRESLKQPLILVFEDLHWIDEGSRTLLNLLAESIGTARVFMLVNYRPEFTHSWGNKTYYTQLRLDPLGAESAEHMLNALLGDGRDLDPLKRTIIAKTEGNPFFMEEIVQALFEQGALIRNGSIKLAKSLNATQIPATVQAVLASRIDRLPPDEKDLLNTLAVIGKEFPMELVRQIAGKPDDELQRMLANLQAAEFVYEQPAFPDVAYVFKHALSQQVAYGSALHERRKALHARIAKVLDAHFSAIVETQPELVAHHYTEAGLSEEAIPYWQRAGERALQRAANPEALNHFMRATELIEGLRKNPQRGDRKSTDENVRCSLLLLMGEAHINLGKHFEAEEKFERAAESARAFGATDLLVRASLSLERMSTWYGLPVEPALNALEYALSRLGPDDRANKTSVLAGLSRALAAAGSAQEAKEAALKSVALARSLNEPELIVQSLQGAIYAFQGPEHTEQRLAYATEMMQLAGTPEKRLYHDLDISYATWSLMVTDLELGRMQEFDAEVDAFMREASKWQDPFGTCTGLSYQAMRALMQGRFADSEHLAQQAAAAAQNLQTDNASGMLALQMFTLRREQGRLRELEPVVRHFVSQNSAAAAWRPGLALIYSEIGLKREASEQFEHLASEQFADIPRDALWMASITYLADVCIFLDDHLRAQTLYDLLLPYAGRNVVVGNASACYGAVSRYLGALASLLGRWSDAAQHFDDAIAMNTRMDARPWLAHTQHQYAEMLHTRNRNGDRDRAVELLGSALAIARELGMNSLEERISRKCN
jgi:class 3 adenylate cyclase/tetratricopeptide (TPR) repeat protein